MKNSFDIRKARGRAYRSGHFNKHELRKFSSASKYHRYYGSGYSAEPIIEQDWITKSGLRAIVVMTYLGHRCGYIALPKNHPRIGDSYGDTEDLQVHGGVTYANQDKVYPIWNKEAYWLGFDCAHYGDAPAPYHPRRMSEWMYENAVHRTLEFCVAQCEGLASQL